MNAGKYTTVWLLVFGIWLSVLASSQSYRQPTTYNQTPSTYHYIFLFIDILFLNNQTTSFVWKTTPSEARVTRDEVSGLKQKEGEAVWKTVPCRCMLIAFFICFGTVFQTALFVILYIPRLRPGLLSLRSVLAFSQSYLQPTIPNQ